eukprot:scaffold12780_cov67-Phaeocystis_antarctica.AAC.3
MNIPPSGLAVLDPEGVDGDHGLSAVTHRFLTDPIAKLWAHVLNQPSGPPGRSDLTCRANAGAHTPVPSCPFFDYKILFGGKQATLTVCQVCIRPGIVDVNFLLEAIGPCRQSLSPYAPPSLLQPQGSSGTSVPGYLHTTVPMFLLSREEKCTYPSAPKLPECTFLAAGTGDAQAVAAWLDGGRRRGRALRRARRRDAADSSCRGRAGGAGADAAAARRERQPAGIQRPHRPDECCSQGPHHGRAGAARRQGRHLAAD